MKNTGMYRPVDELGRIVIPKEIRRNLGIKEGSTLEFLSDGKVVILRLFAGHSCMFCGNGDELYSFKNKLVCKECLNEKPTAPMATADLIAAMTEYLEGEDQVSPTKEKIKQRKPAAGKRGNTAAQLEVIRGMLEKNPNITKHDVAQVLGLGHLRAGQLLKLIK